ncbi:MAG: hypothetical protein JO255_21315, partial [Alphaproteobacteria bacterium]|nr:hypothetical protein [Alphaproteobacteria bacterium]
MFRAPYVASVLLVEWDTAFREWKILEEGHLSSRSSYPELLGRLAATAARLVAAALRSDGPRTPRRLAVQSEAGAGTAWGMGHLLRGKADGARSRWLDRLTVEKWSIGIAEGSSPSAIVGRALGKVRWLERPADGYLADPFHWPGRPEIVLCERYLEEERRGIVCAAHLDGDRIQRLETLDFGVGCHLSYPFCWAEGGQVFCVPESSESRRTTLYRLDDAGGPPTPVATIAEGIAMADPTIFRHGGLYWLAYADVDVGRHDALCLMHAEALEGPWRPHARNPVKIDIRSSRPAGAPFVIDGVLYRPAQDCSRTYGGAVVVNRVLAC